MYRKRSKRSQRIRFFMTYTLVPMLITVLVVVLTMYMVGYRFDTEDNTIVQGGLLQFDSFPGGATVAVDGITIGGRTATRLDASAGSHTVTLSRDGYHPWQKTATVEPGEILWLNYARLVPKVQEVKKLYAYTTLASAIAAHEKERLALLPDPAKPEIDIIKTDNASAPRNKMVLPAALYAKADETKLHEFALKSWDRSGRYLLVTHRVGETVEWLAVDTEAVDDSKNISTIAGQPISQAVFDETGSRQLYVVTDGMLRRVNGRESTISAPLAHHVTHVHQSEKGVVTFVTSDDATHTRTIGYYTPGASRSETLQTTKSSDGALDGQIIEYARAQYQAILTKSTLAIAKLSLHPSDSELSLAPTSIATLSLPDGADSVSFSPNGRFVVAQKAVSLVVYDLELNRRYAFTLRDDTSASPRLRWFDDYHLYSDANGTLRWYEFDGENSRAIMPVAPGYDTILSNDGKYLYAVQTDGTSKQVVRMTVIK